MTVFVVDSVTIFPKNQNVVTFTVTVLLFFLFLYRPGSPTTTDRPDPGPVRNRGITSHNRL